MLLADQVVEQVVVDQDTIVVEQEIHLLQVQLKEMTEDEVMIAHMVVKDLAQVAEAERRLMQWEKSADTATRATPFPLTIQPALVGGEDAAIILEGVTAELKVGELRALIHDKMKSKPEPDQQRLFIAQGAQKPLEDGTLPIGAYGVVSGVTLHLATRDAAAAAARRAARAQVRAAQAAAKAARLNELFLDLVRHSPLRSWLRN